MISSKLFWLILGNVMFLEGSSNQNTTESSNQGLTPSLQAFSTSLPKSNTLRSFLFSTTQSATLVSNMTSPSSLTTLFQKNLTSTTDPEAEIVKILHRVVSFKNGTGTSENEEIQITDPFFKCFNSTFLNANCSEIVLNETLKTNYTIVGEVIDSSDDFSAYRLEKTAAIAAGVFLVSAIIGYISCIGYRRHLQRKYDSGQILIPQEVYDTTDLRYFEI